MTNTDPYGTGRLARARQQKALQLYREWLRWHDALTALDSDFNITREQETRDELVDYLEAHELNHSRWDPRGGGELK